MDLAAYSEVLALPGGGPIRIRAIRPGDKDLLLEAFMALSPLSVRYRFLQSKETLTEKELTYYTEMDFINHVGLVAVVVEAGRERISAVGRFAVIDPASPIVRAEFGIAVVDEFQGRGMGSALMETLADLARSRGVS
ncbi:MAG: GNAT family N-acetyltransferase, partial [Planctomycetota bacterium]